MKLMLLYILWKILDDQVSIRIPSILGITPLDLNWLAVDFCVIELLHGLFRLLMSLKRDHGSSVGGILMNCWIFDNLPSSFREQLLQPPHINITWQIPHEDLAGVCFAGIH